MQTSPFEILCAGILMEGLDTWMIIRAAGAAHWRRRRALDAKTVQPDCINTTRSRIHLERVAKSILKSATVAVFI
jgi:hypothetical protein